jgi:hypothetical protein
MNGPFVPANLTPDQLFTVVLGLAWELHGQSVERRVPDIALDLVVAIGELEQGPWRKVADAPVVLPLPMTLGCSLLDVLLDELGRIAPGFGARVAVAQVRAALDPLPASSLRTKLRPGVCPLRSAVCCFSLHRPSNAEET